MERNITKILVILICIIVIICIVCFIILKYYGNTKTKQQQKQENPLANPIDAEVILDTDREYNTANKVKNATMFFTVEKCIQTNIDNSEKLKGYTFVAKAMTESLGKAVMEYNVYGYIYNDENKQNIFAKARLDTMNNTYEVKLYNSNEYNTVNDIEFLQDDTQIEVTDNNQFKYVRLSDEDICRKYFRYYNNLLLTDPEEAYDLLNDEYKEIRFANMDIFKKYIEDSKEKIERAALSGYSVERGTDTTKYVLKDSLEDYYTLEEDAIMNFKIKLDAYTIPESNFDESYAELKEAEKTSANIGIFIQMINSKDFTHAYEKLSDGFKEKYFNTQEQFENYVKNNWYNAIGYEIKDYKNEGKIYIYEIALRKLDAREKTTMDKNFNIRLNENNDRNFEISFNVD